MKAKADGLDGLQRHADLPEVRDGSRPEPADAVPMGLGGAHRFDEGRVGLHGVGAAQQADEEAPEVPSGDRPALEPHSKQSGVEVDHQGLAVVKGDVFAIAIGEEDLAHHATGGW